MKLNGFFLNSSCAFIFKSFLKSNSVTIRPDYSAGATGCRDGLSRQRIGQECEGVSELLNERMIKCEGWMEGMVQIIGGSIRRRETRRCRAK